MQKKQLNKSMIAKRDVPRGTCEEGRTFWQFSPLDPGTNGDTRKK